MVKVGLVKIFMNKIYRYNEFNEILKHSCSWCMNVLENSNILFGAKVIGRKSWIK